MTATIGRRRLEMTADRIEACCAGHKVTGRVVRIRARRNRAVMVVSTSPPYDLRKLKEEFSLSLGVPVTVYRDAVICEVLP